MPIDERTHAWLTTRYWGDDDLLARARDSFADLGPLIEVPNETGALLATLIRLGGARRVLEVGTLFGYSAVWMARALPGDGALDTLELEDAHADFAEQLLRDAALADRVHVHRGPAADTLATLDGPYDLVFLDADKVGYPRYLDRLVELVRPGGAIVADNVAQGGRVADPSEVGDSVVAIREYLERISTHPLLDSNVLPIGDGIAVSVRRS